MNGKPNSIPVAFDISVTVGKNTQKSILLNATDADGDELTFSIPAGGDPSHGMITLDGTVCTYTPASGFFGQDSFRYRASDGKSESNIARVTVNVASGNHAPMAYGNSVTTPEDVPITITLCGSDPDGDTLVFHIDEDPVHGTLTKNTSDGSHITYTPEPDYNGSDKFCFYVSDGEFVSRPGVVAITIGPENDPPTAEEIRSVTTPEDGPILIRLKGSDPENDPLTWHVTQPLHGSVSVPDGCEVLYTPAPDYYGEDGFHYYVSDGRAGSAPAAVHIVVTPVNDIPVALAKAVNVKRNVAHDFTLQVYNPDNDALTYVVDEEPRHGTLIHSGAACTYTPNPGFMGDDSFTFHVMTDHDRSDSVAVPISVSERGIIFVDTEAPEFGDGRFWNSAFRNIQEAVDSAVAGDQIWVRAGVYAPMDAASAVLVAMKEGVELYGGFRGDEYRLSERAFDIGMESGFESGASILDGGGSVFHVLVGAEAAVLDGFIIQGGMADGGGIDDNGGGMLVVDCSPVIRNCVFRSNHASGDGGAVCNYNSNPSVLICGPSISNCRFENNFAGSDGGAVYNYVGTSPEMMDCAFNSNSAGNGFGGGICNYGESTSIQWCAFTGNFAANGGGVCGSFGSALEIVFAVMKNCSFEGNKALLDGGGLYCFMSRMRLVACEFTANEAGNDGGGIFNENERNLTFLDCIFTANIANENGGGIFNARSSPLIDGCVFSGNRAKNGGGLNNYNFSSPVLIECCFSSNKSSNGGDGGGVFNYFISNPVMTKCDFSRNDSAGNGGGMYNLDRCSPVIDACTFSENGAIKNGAGIFNGSYCLPVMKWCEISGCTQAKNGAGMYNMDYSSPRLTDCVVRNNHASLNGGGVCNYNGSNPLFINCLIAENAASFGGGVYENASSPIFINCTIGKNVVYDDGDEGVNTGTGLYNDAESAPRLVNCVVWSVDIDSPVHVVMDVNSTCDASYSVIQMQNGVYPGAGNLNVNPLFAGPNNYRMINISLKNGGDPETPGEICDLLRARESIVRIQDLTEPDDLVADLGYHY